MIYEMRTYTLKPRSVDIVEKIIGEVLPNRLKYSKLVGFWHTDIGPLNQIIHIWEYNDMAHRDQVRAATSKDPNWPPKIAEYIVSQESKILAPAAFSPIK
jgi:hypothetical protein